MWPRKKLVCCLKAVVQSYGGTQVTGTWVLVGQQALLRSGRKRARCHLARSWAKHCASRGPKITFHSKKENLANEGIQKDIMKKTLWTEPTWPREETWWLEAGCLWCGLKGEGKDMYGVGWGHLLVVFQDYYSLRFQLVGQHFLAENFTNFPYFQNKIQNFQHTIDCLATVYLPMLICPSSSPHSHYALTIQSHWHHSKMQVFLLCPPPCPF